MGTLNGHSQLSQLISDRRGVTKIVQVYMTPTKLSCYIPYKLRSLCTVFLRVFLTLESCSGWSFCFYRMAINIEDPLVYTPPLLSDLLAKSLSLLNGAQTVINTGGFTDVQMGL